MSDLTMNPMALYQMINDPRANPMQRMQAMQALRATRSQGAPSIGQAASTGEIAAPQGGGGPQLSPSQMLQQKQAQDRNSDSPLDVGAAAAQRAQAKLSSTPQGSGGANPDGGDIMPPQMMDMVKKFVGMGGADDGGDSEAPTPQEKGMALAQAGFGMAASGSPYFGQALGQGAMAGLQSLQQMRQQRALNNMKKAMMGFDVAKEQALEQSRADELAAKKDEIALRGKTIDQQNDYNKQHLQLMRDQLDQGKFTLTHDQFGNEKLLNTKTGETTEMPGNASGASVDRTAEAIANYKRAPLSAYALRTPYGMMISDKIYDYNPDYNDQLYASSLAARKKFDAGTNGDTIRSMNVALSHLQTFDAMVNAQDNGDVKAYNKFKNELARQFGGVQISGLDAAQTIVGDEVAKAILGNRTALADRQKYAEPLTTAKGKDAILGASDTFKALMVGQLQGQKHQYENEVKAKDFEDKLEPGVRDLLKDPRYQPGVNPVVDPGAAAGGGGGAKIIPDHDIEMLRSGKGTRAQFEAVYGPGSADPYLPKTAPGIY